MKKLSKMVLLLGSVFLLTLFASCSNGSSSDDSREPDTLLAGKAFYQELNDIMMEFNEDGKSFKFTCTNAGIVTEGSYYVKDNYYVYVTYPEFSDSEVFYIKELPNVGTNPDSYGQLQYIVNESYDNDDRPEAAYWVQ